MAQIMAKPIIVTTWQKWYAANKEDVAQRRKHRYDTDPEYRKKALGYAAAARANRKKTKKPETGLPTYPYTQLEAAAVLGMSPSTIRDWLRKGYLPKPKLHKRKFVYTPQQVNMLESLRDYLRDHGSKTGVHAPEFEDLKAFILVNWH